MTKHSQLCDTKETPVALDDRVGRSACVVAIAAGRRGVRSWQSFYFSFVLLDCDNRIVRNLSRFLWRPL